MKCKAHLKKRLWLGLIALGTFCSLSTTTVYGGGNSMMDYLYDFKDSIALEPEMFKIEAGTTLSLFPVPMDNAVGTNDIRNAVSVLSFAKGKLSVDHSFRRSLRDIQGGGTYLPVVSKDVIGFGQTRAFYLFNFKTGKAEEYRIVFSLDDTIEKIAVADAEKRRFIFEIESHRHGSSDPWDITKSLRLIELNKKEVNLVKQVKKESGSIWIKAYERVFLLYFDEKEIKVFDMNLEPSEHPLADAIDRKKSMLDFTRFQPHPLLPFVILYGGKAMPDTLLIWEQNRNLNPQPLIGNARQFSFSPDGKWVVFKRYMGRDHENTYLMPVSDKYPNYLGSPILLFNGFFNEKNFAWTDHPVSFVGHNGRALYRWELTKEAQKKMMGDDYDKYETFHDWIVEKDLEKLTKEKKQGLK